MQTQTQKTSKNTPTSKINGQAHLPLLNENAPISEPLINTASLQNTSKKSNKAKKHIIDSTDETAEHSVEANLEQANSTLNEAVSFVTAASESTPSTTTSEGSSSTSNVLWTGLGILGAAGIAAVASSSSSSNKETTSSQTILPTEQPAPEVPTEPPVEEPPVEEPPVEETPIVPNATLAFSHFVDTGLSHSDGVTRDNTFKLALSNTDNIAKVAYQRWTEAENTWIDQDETLIDTADGSYTFRAVITSTTGHQTITDSTSITVDTGKTQINSFTVNWPENLTFHNYDASGKYYRMYMNYPLDYGPVGITFSIDTDGSEYNVSYATAFYAYSDSTYSASSRFWIPIIDRSPSDSYFQALATDLAGNQSLLQKPLDYRDNTISISVDDHPADSTYIDTAFDFMDNMSGFDEISNDNNYTIRFSFGGPYLSDPAPTDANGTILPYEYIIAAKRSSDGGKTWEALNWDGNTHLIEQENMPDGEYGYSFESYNRVISTGEKFNYRGVTDSHMLTIDTVAPEAGELFVNHQSHNNALYQTEDGTFDLSLIGMEDKALFNLQISNDDGSTWQVTQSSQTSLADGSYLFRAQVADMAGNISYSDALQVLVDQTLINTPLI